MKFILSPAVALMNRLNFTLKSSLICSLILAPLLAAEYYLTRDVYEQISTARVERESLQTLHTYLDIVRDLQALADLSELLLVHGTTGRAAEAIKKSDALEESVLKKLDSMTWNDTGEFGKKRDAIVTSMKAASKEQLWSAKLEIRRKQLAHSLNLGRFIFSDAGLSQDSDRAIRQLVDLLASSTPRVTAILGTTRAVGSLVMLDQQLGSASAIRLEQALMALASLEDEYRQTLDDLKEPALAEPAAQSLQTLKHQQDVLANDLLASDQLNTPWQTFYAKVTDEMAKTYNFNEAVLELIDEKLQARMDRQVINLGMLIAFQALLLLVIVYLFCGYYVSIRASLQGLGTLLEQVEKGDMTSHYIPSSRDELGDLGHKLSRALARTRELIVRVSATATQVAQRTAQVEVHSVDGYQAISSQRDQINLLATAMSQMTASSQSVAGNAAMAVDSAHRVNQQTVNGRALIDSQVAAIADLSSEMEQSVAAIDRLAQNSHQISRVVEVINSIAQQTNLLALNAAIEAARAGEQGRGFAVVADEVRTLAKRTQQSTSEIGEMIDVLGQGVAKAVETMNTSHDLASRCKSQSQQVEDALTDILKCVADILDQSQQIAAAAQQQSAVALEIDRNIVEINSAGTRTATGAGHTEDACRQLSILVVQMEEAVGRFSV
ncbi:methyl-accepting chemotaxis protein [Pseudomonas lini]|nr:methyl-accepting chemotaxis protein [Pseudomonas lini]MDQ0124896.1 methyl-accepting chemotaxis protein [Pseudomonas lini]